MAIVLKCKKCGKSHKVGEEHAGKKIRCKCGVAITIPSPSAAPKNRSTKERAATSKPKQTRPKPAPAEPPPEDDGFFGMSEDDDALDDAMEDGYDDDGMDEAPMPSVSSRSSRSRSGGSRKSKKSSAAGISPMVWLAAGGGGLVLVVVIVLAVMFNGGGNSDAVADGGNPPVNGGTIPPAPGTGQPAPPAPSGGTLRPTEPNTGEGKKAELVHENIVDYLSPSTTTRVYVDIAGATAAARAAAKSHQRGARTDQLTTIIQPILASTGLKTPQIRQVAMGSDVDGELMVAIRTMEPLGQDEVRNHLGCQGDLVTLGQDLSGYVMRDADPEAGPFACFVAPDLLLMGSKQQLIESESNQQSSMPSIIPAVAQDTALHAWVVSDPVTLTPMLQMLTDMGASESFYAPALLKVKQLAMGFEVGTGIHMRIALACDSAESAQLATRVAGSVRSMLQKKSEEDEKQASRFRDAQSGAAGGPEGDDGAGGPGGDGGGGGPGDGANPIPLRWNAFRQGQEGAGGPGGAGGGAGGGDPGQEGAGGPGQEDAGGPGGGSDPGQGGGQGGSTLSKLWSMIKVGQFRSDSTIVQITLPIIIMAEGAPSGPLDLFSLATKVSLVKDAVGAPAYPGPLRQMSLGIERLVATDTRMLPPGVLVPEAKKDDDEPNPVQHVSWMANLLPYVGEHSLYNKIDFNESWTHSKNIPSAVTLVEAFLDPRVVERRAQGRRLEGLALTHFVGMAGVGPDSARLPASDNRAGIFGYYRQAKLGDVKDGLSNTIMIIQARDVFGPWMAGGGATVRGAHSPPYIDHLGGFGSPDGSAMAIFADGSVRSIPKEIDNDVFEAMCTMHGGESVDLQGAIRELMGPLR